VVLGLWDVRASVESEKSSPTLLLEDRREMRADLVVGANGIHPGMREILVGKPQPSTKTGDLAYRLLLDTKEMLKDPKLAPFVSNSEVNYYWIGPDAHVGMFLKMIIEGSDD
jgi:salicylate hydroxylase